jgi:hypothetical protein
MADEEKQTDHEASAIPGERALEKAGSIAEQLGVDAAYEKRLVRKLDIHIVPMVLLLYLFSFLDR